MEEQKQEQTQPQQAPQQTQERHLSRHEARRLRKEQRKQERLQELKKQGTKRTRGRMLTYIVIALVFVIGGYGIYAFSTSPITGNAVSEFNLAGIPSNFVHWHADVNAYICGEKKDLPEAVGSGMIGTGGLHTHSKSSNIGSLPGSDGNGVIHTEGVISQSPEDHTLGRFMANIYIPFSETQIMEKKNGDTCPDGKPGQVKVYLNGNELNNFMNYLPRDGDFIDIKFE